MTNTAESNHRGFFLIIEKRGSLLSFHYFP